MIYCRLSKWSVAFNCSALSFPFYLLLSTLYAYRMAAYMEKSLPFQSCKIFWLLNPFSLLFIHLIIIYNLQ